MVINLHNDDGSNVKRISFGKVFIPFGHKRRPNKTCKIAKLNSFGVMRTDELEKILTENFYQEAFMVSIVRISTYRKLKLIKGGIFGKIMVYRFDWIQRSW